MAEQLKLGILFGDSDDRPPAEIAAGWETAEIPVELVVRPLVSDARWEAGWHEVQSWNLPPITASSHFVPLYDLLVTGPDVDWELLALWSRRTFRRLSEAGVAAAGLYGAFFKHREGYPGTRAMDDAIRFVNLIADDAEPYGIQIALEPQSDLDNLWPRYLQGLEFVRKEIARPDVVRLMADIDYFIALDQPFEDIGVAPEYCLNVHIAGHKGQPMAGVDDAVLTHLFRVLRDVGYTRSVTSACNWVPTDGGNTLRFGAETARTLAYLQDLRAGIYAE
jgi:sugar phosphate isomerase/epimerase